MSLFDKLVKRSSESGDAEAHERFLRNMAKLAAMTIPQTCAEEVYSEIIAPVSARLVREPQPQQQKVDPWPDNAQACEHAAAKDARIGHA